MIWRMSGRVGFERVRRVLEHVVPGRVCQVCHGLRRSAEEMGGVDVAHRQGEVEAHEKLGIR